MIAGPALLGAKLLLLVTVSPTPTPTVELSGARTGPYIPIDTQPNQDGAGGNAFLIIGVLIVACVILFWAMNRSLKTARRNLGGGAIPESLKPTRFVIPQQGEDPPPAV